MNQSLKIDKVGDVFPEHVISMLDIKAKSREYFTTYIMRHFIFYTLIC